MLAPEQLHSAPWRASQLGRASTHCIDTGHPTLSRQLPGGGWPCCQLVDLLLPQPGIGELRLLRPARVERIQRRVVLQQPPHTPQALALAGLGLPPEQVPWLRPSKSADTLWAADQVLRSNSCGALLYWSGGPVRNDAVRRLHLAAGAGDTLFYMLRPMASAGDASPAPLRLALQPADGGLNLTFLKRRGPQRDAPLFLPLSAPVPYEHATVDRRQPAPPPVESTRYLAELGRGP